MLNVVSVIIVLGVLIFVHELGHFLVAKAVGVQVLRFSLGFGRPLIAWRRGETEYWVSWIPLGGYVKMAGLEEEGMAGEPRPAVMPLDSVEVAALPTGAEGLSTLRRGDRIPHINGDSLKTWDQFEGLVVAGPEELRLRVAGRPEPLVLHVPPPRDTAARYAIVRAVVPLFPPRIGPLELGQPAHRAGLKGGDIVVRVGADTITAWSDMVRRIRANPGKPLVFTVLRGDRLTQIPITPEAKDSAGAHFGVIGAYLNRPTVRVPVNLGSAVALGAGQTVGQVGVVVTSVKRLVTGRSSARELGGPIAIAQMSGQAARLGLDWFLSFLAFFSVSLAVLNLLPIPVLDGGHAMFLIAEAIYRRPLSPQLRLRLTQVGMLVVLAIMVVALGNDVLRLFR